MNIVLIGAGQESSRIRVALETAGHTVMAQLQTFAPNHLEMFSFKLLVVVSPEASIQIPTLVTVAEHGITIILVAGASDGLAAWAAGTGVPTFSYPMGTDTAGFIEVVNRVNTGGYDAGEQYRKVVLGSDAAARVTNAMIARRIVITSPKGGTGKTTMSVNLAVALALSGITTYLVDADSNAGGMQYHLRLAQYRTTLINLLRSAAETRTVVTSAPMSGIAEAGKYLGAFTPIEELPTLKVLPGMVTTDLGDAALGNQQAIRTVINGLFDAGVNSGGVVIMDVGINPSHPVHAAALSAAEAVAVVIKPEIPDLAESRRWVNQILRTGTELFNGDKRQAQEFVASRLRVCYNMVVGSEFKTAHTTLSRALQEDEFTLSMAPNGIIPAVPIPVAAHAINSDDIRDIMVWNYKRTRSEDLQGFSEALVAFAAQFVPTIREGAVRVGLVSDNGQGKQKKSLFRK